MQKTESQARTGELSVTVGLIEQICFKLFFEIVQWQREVGQVVRKTVPNLRRCKTKGATCENSPGNTDV